MKITTKYFIISFLILFIAVRAAEPNSTEVVLNKGNMPYCVYDSFEEGKGIVFHWDASSKKIPREIFYSKQNCRRHQPFVKKSKIRFVENLPPRFIEDIELTADVQNRLLSVRAGINKYIKSADLEDPKLLNSIFSPFKKETNELLINDYHVQTSSTLFHNWITLKQLPNDCSSLVGTCEYYHCRETQKSCNIDGYFLGFGYQYCSESIENLSSKVSPRAQSWLKNVAACLQNKMEDISNDNSCADIKDQAIKSHDECYTETDFCSLELKDAYKIIKMLRPEFDDKRIIKEGLEVLRKCRI